MAKIKQLDPKIVKMMDEGRWFWSDEFIKPHSNPFLVELEQTYAVVLETIRNHDEFQIVDALLSLNIKTALLMKHIMVLMDTSAETLDRAAMYIRHRGIRQLTLPDKVIQLQKLPDFTGALSNENISKASAPLKRDLLNLMTFAYQSKEFGKFDTFKSCKLAELAGKAEQLNEHLYYLGLRSSSQIKQIRAVDLGAQLEALIEEYLTPLLDELRVTKTKRYKDQQFDRVLVKGDKHIILEIAFQETTNSTLERKAKQAKNGLYKTVDENGDKLIYIVDGAGYYKRNNALSDLIDNSHLACTVSEVGLKDLSDFISSYFR